MSVTPNREVCPGEEVTYKCTVGGTGIAWHIERKEINLALIPGGNLDGHSGNYYWTLLEQDNITLQSTLTFPAAVGINVRCRNETESLPVSLGVPVLGKCMCVVLLLFWSSGREMLFFKWSLLLSALIF